MTQSTTSSGDDHPVSGTDALVNQFFQRSVHSNTTAEKGSSQIAGDTVGNGGSIMGRSNSILLECTRIVISVGRQSQSVDILEDHALRSLL